MEVRLTTSSKLLPKKKKKKKNLLPLYHSQPEAYLEPSQKSMMEFLAKTVTG